MRSAGVSLVRTGLPALADQAAFAGTHLLVNVVLARSLAPSEYGAFALAYGLYLIADALHHGLVNEPLLVLSQREFSDRFDAYLGAVLWGHAGLSVVSGMGLLAASGVLWLVGIPAAASALTTLALACPVLLLALLARRVCYARLAPRVAASGGLVYAGAVAALLVPQLRAGGPSVTGAVVALAVASLVSVAWMALGLRVVPRLRPQRALLRETLERHWGYGRFATLASLAKWVPWNLHFILLAGVLTLDGVGAIRALYNILLPLRHAMGSLAMSALPVLSQEIAGPRPHAARATALRMAALCGVAGVGYTALVGIFGESMLTTLYADRYTAWYPLAVWVAAIQLPVTGTVVAGLLLRASGRSDRALLTNLPFAVLSLVLGGVGAMGWGPEGLVFGILAASLAALVVVMAQVHRWSPWRSATDGAPVLRSPIHTSSRSPTSI